MYDEAIQDALELLEQEIRKAHPRARLEFSDRVFEGHAELWVYVLSPKDFPAIDRQCQSLMKEWETKPYPFWVFAKSWTGPWPGGEGEAVLKQRRKEFLERLRANARAKAGK
jgi:hypothetical protein